MKTFSTVPCEPCDGTGRLLDPVDVGHKMMARRKSTINPKTRRKITIYEMARRMNCSPSYISFLEAGERAWSDELIQRYERGLAS